MKIADIRSVISETPSYLMKQRWFLRKKNEIESVNFKDGWTVRAKENEMIMNSIVEVNYRGGGSDIYFLPLILKQEQPSGSLSVSGEFISKEYFENFMNTFWSGMKFETLSGEGSFVEFRREPPALQRSIGAVKQFSGELSNTIVFLDEKEVVKVYRRLSAGINPDLEAHIKLSPLGGSPVPALLGYVLYNAKDSTKYILAMIEKYVKNDGDAWQYFLGKIREYSETGGGINFEKDLRMLGVTIAKLHFDFLKAFGSEDFSDEDIKEWKKRLIAGVGGAVSSVPPEIRGGLQKFVSMVDNIRDFGKKIRIHGDLHLGQLLKTPSGYCVIDFEGEPLKASEENRKKTSPLKDIAGILRSFNYAANYYRKREQSGADAVNVEQDSVQRALSQADAVNVEQDSVQRALSLATWEKMAAANFLDSYYETVKRLGCDFLPHDSKSLEQMLSLYEIEKAMYELDYEANSRPDWIDVPLSGIKKILGERERTI